MQPGFELRFKEGDIVYWCRNKGNANYEVGWGMVDTQFHDAVCIDFLAMAETRLIDGIPLEEFESEDKFRKLPKGWSYDTKLFDVTYRDTPSYEDCKNLRIDRPEDVKLAYEKGLLVKDSTLFHGNIETEITKEGFRVVKKYPDWQHHITTASIRSDKVYPTYKEAKDEVDANIAEFKRQASLSEYDWSVEQIDKLLNWWQRCSDITDYEKNQYREWLLNMKNVEDIETRVFGANIQWKYYKNKRWMNIEL